jgi:hypothetical protein
MRRTSVRLGLGIVASVVIATGCTGLLGDFDVGGAGSDAGPNGDDGPTTQDGQGPGDGSKPNDGGADAPTTNDAADATPVDANDGGGLVTLNCIEQGGVTRNKVGTILRGNSNDGYRAQLFNASVGNQTQYRAFVPERSANPQVNHLYSFGNGGNAKVTDIPIPSAAGNILSITRYATGIAALATGTAAGTSFLEVLKLDDSASTWSTPVVLATGAPLPSCMNQSSGSLAVRDAANNDYLAEVAFVSCGTGGAATHLVEHYSSGAGTLQQWPLPPGTTPPDAGADAGTQGFSTAGIVVDGNSVFATTNPQGNQGPVTGVASSIYSSALSLVAPNVRQLPLVAPGDIMQTTSVSVRAAGSIGFGILEADLSTQTGQPVFYVGTIPSTSISTFDPAGSLRKTALPSIQDLPINGATYHWESFTQPPTDNLLAVGSIFPNANGLNFIWWNANGGVRSIRTNTNAFFYGSTVYAGDVTFNSPPFAALAGLELIFIQADDEASTLADVWATQLACTP